MTTDPEPTHTTTTGSEAEFLADELWRIQEGWDTAKAEIDRLRTERDEAQDSLQRTRIELKHWQHVIVGELRTERDNLTGENERLQRELADARFRCGRLYAEVKRIAAHAAADDRTMRWVSDALDSELQFVEDWGQALAGQATQPSEAHHVEGRPA